MYPNSYIKQLKIYVKNVIQKIMECEEVWITIITNNEHNY